MSLTSKGESDIDVGEHRRNVTRQNAGDRDLQSRGARKAMGASEEASQHHVKGGTKMRTAGKTMKDVAEAEGGKSSRARSGARPEIALQGSG